MRDSLARIHQTLPVFRLENRCRCVLYTPSGHLAVVEPDVADDIVRAWERGGTTDETTAREVAAWLQTQAERTVMAWRQKRDSPFRPECLTIYLSNHCNLACSYCYTAPERQKAKQRAGDSPHIRTDIALAAADIVAQNCAEQKKPFDLVLHGGGEPTLHWKLVERLETSTRRISERSGIEWRGHIATNGVFSAQKAQWLARHFSSIGLSCDGPPEIQNRQRPFPGGETSSEIVERTAEALKHAGGTFTIRTTVTPQTVKRQVEIVTYLHEHLFAEKIRFEPLYSLGNIGQTAWSPDDAEPFAEHFLKAQEEANARGISLTYSGVRLEELHGPYCDALRHVLHLNPDGTASACFFSTNAQGAQGAFPPVGHFDKNIKQFVVDDEQIEAHRQKAFEIPEQCFHCLNIYHCARACPELCALSPSTNIHDHFRCQVQQRLTSAWIFQAADTLAARQQTQTLPHHSVRNAAETTLNTFLCDLPSGIDAEAIVRQWEAVRNAYRIETRRMPSPIWSERGFQHNGPKAWQQLRHDIPLQQNDGAMAIYIHIPFCEQRCRFCDCLSVPLGRRHRKEHENAYLQKLFTEIQLWSTLAHLQQRPISTVHLGGGTPNYLSVSGFSELLNQCQVHFQITPQTEFSLESTSSLLDAEHLYWLRQLGFSRLHVGVQTLQEPLRHSIGRRDAAERVLEKLALALEKGFVTSVDLIYGLPGQSASGLVETLQRLIALAIHGMSLYRLNRSRRNRRFFEKHPQFTPNALHDYLLFHVAEQTLTRAHYRKNHFTHFARSEDRNLYYTHARRGEDLLALGASADGVFGNYHYRHSEYTRYRQESCPGIPDLEGGIRESPLEQKLSPAIAELLTANVSQTRFRELRAETLHEHWQERLLLQQEANSDRFSLTANGSWLVNDMIAELKHWARV